MKLLVNKSTGEITAYRKLKEFTIIKSKKYCEKELKIGIKEEMTEHNMTKEKAELTAKQHLDGDPKYYSKLKNIMKKSFIFKKDKK